MSFVWWIWLPVWYVLKQATYLSHSEFEVDNERNLVPFWISFNLGPYLMKLNFDPFLNRMVMHFSSENSVSMHLDKKQRECIR